MSGAETPEMRSDQGYLPIAVEGGPRVLAEILAGGQSFLWEAVSPFSWRGVVGSHPCQIEIHPDGSLEWTHLGSPQPGVREEVEEFFAAGVDFSRITDALPWRSDPVLQEAVNAFPGLRILRQPPATALLSFLLSPLKRIDQIRDGLLQISRHWGTQLANGLYAPPSWESLSCVSEDNLRNCGIGYRARSIHRTALFLHSRPGYLDSLHNLSSTEARTRLLALPGVGRKIADCVLLFGYGRLESFPIDTWISRTMRSVYELDSFSDSQIHQFASAHYGKFAGVAQQFLFAWARMSSRQPLPPAQN